MKQISILNDKNLLLVLNVKRKKFIFNGIMASMFDDLVMKKNLIYSVKIERIEFEIENLKIIFIDVKSDDDLGLK